LDKDLKGERAIVLAAASKDGGIVQFLPSEFREHLNDKKIALAAVRSAGWSLQFFGESIRDDDEIVEEAIKEDGYAIRYASARIRDIERYALLAIENGNIVIDGLSDRLKGEIDIVRAAARKNPRSISFVDQKFFTDPEIQKLVFECDISLIKEPELLSPELKARYDSIMAKAREFNIPVDKFNTSQLEELIHNRTHLDGEDDRPLAVIIDPMSDDEGAFDYQGSERDIFDTHRVVYFRVNNTVELLQHYRAVTEHKKVDLLFVGGHGTSDRLHLGDVGDYDVRYLDKSDAKELMAIERGLEDDATVIFFSCSLFNVFVGESFGRMASRIIDGRRLFGLYRPDDWMTFQVEVDEMDGIKVEGLHDRSIVRCIDGECKIVD